MYEHGIQHHPVAVSNPMWFHTCSYRWPENSPALDPRDHNAKALDDGIRKVKERNFWDNHTNGTFETKSENMAIFHVLLTVQLQELEEVNGHKYS